MTKKAKVPILLFSLFTAICVFPTACYYDNEVEQYGILTCDTTTISFNRDVMPIIQNNCVSCHQPGAQQSNSPMTNYAQIKAYVQNRQLSNRINGIGGLMPPSGKMPLCNIQIIEAWLNIGAPDN